MRAGKHTSKEEFFRRPTIKEIKEGKTPTALLLGDRHEFMEIDTIENIVETSFLMLEHNIVPGVSGGGNRKDWLWFNKHGPRVELVRYHSREEAARERIPFWKQREELLTPENVDIGTKFAGICYYGIREEEVLNVIHPVNCIEAAKLLAFCDNSADPNNKITIEPYDAVRGVEKFGGKYDFKVPSRSKKRKRYDVRLESVPVGDDDMQYANIYDLSYSNHSCEMQRGFSTYERVIPVRFFCPHVIAAYLKLAQVQYHEGKKLPYELNPFFVPSQKTVNIYHNMKHHVFIKFPKRAPRRMNTADMNILLMQLVSKYGNPSKGPNKTFCPEPNLKIQNYDW